MKILFILSRFPYPLEKGDKLRAYYQIKNLAAKHEVVLFALNEGSLKPESLQELKKLCKHVEVVHLSKLTIGLNMLKAFFGNMPLQVGYFYSAAAQKKLNSFIAEQKPDHIFCQLIRTSEYARNSPIPKTLDYMDVFSKGIERRKASAPFFLRLILNLEYNRLKEYERNIFSCFNNRVIISRQDGDLIPHPENAAITVISNGVDTDFFKPLTRKKEFDILFNGNMNYPPNIESAEYLVNNVLPLVKKKHPNVKVLISGTDPGRRIQALASENVKVSGWVEDIRESFASSKMLVAPMFLSIGLQNKLLEAMAMQIPCVTSSLANNALGGEDGKNILVADTPEKYAEHIITLLENAQRASELAMNGYNFVLEKHRWQMETEKLEKLILGK